LYATALTVPSERLNPASETLFTIAGPQSNGTTAILAWFYPGEATGHKFEYSKSEESELIQDKQETLLAGPHGTAVISGL
jgi:hypothetical protein